MASNSTFLKYDFTYSLCALLERERARVCVHCSLLLARMTLVIHVAKSQSAGCCQYRVRALISSDSPNTGRSACSSLSTTYKVTPHLFSFTLSESTKHILYFPPHGTKNHPRTIYIFAPKTKLDESAGIC